MFTFHKESFNEICSQEIEFSKNEIKNGINRENREKERKREREKICEYLEWCGAGRQSRNFSWRKTKKKKREMKKSEFILFEFPFVSEVKSYKAFNTVLGIDFSCEFLLLLFYFHSILFHSFLPLKYWYLSSVIKYSFFGIFHFRLILIEMGPKRRTHNEVVNE